MYSDTLIAQHEWVKHTITPVSVLPNDDGEPVVLVDPDEQAASEHAMTVYGCLSCGEPLATHHNKPCEGASSDN